MSTTDQPPQHHFAQAVEHVCDAAIFIATLAFCLLIYTAPLWMLLLFVYFLARI